MGKDVSDKLCRGCHRYKPEAQIESKRVVKHKTSQGSTTYYLCVSCADKQRARAAKAAG